MKNLFISVLLVILINCNAEVRNEIIKLPAPEKKGSVSLEATLQSRRSRRGFGEEALDLSEVSQLLWAAYGINKPIPNARDFLRGGLRTAPSAGALYPLELYLVAGNVQALPAGLYKYDSEHHSLKLIKSGDLRADIARASYDQSWMAKAAVHIFYAAVYSRTTDKYGERGRDRYVCMDLGHSAQNVYLQCETLDLSTCAVGAFDDKQISRIMELSEEETPLYIMPVGKRKE